jgi:hypothetical protein
MTMTGYEAYCQYLAVKNHFTLDNYDYIKYNGRTSAKESTFLKRRDKFFFTKLGKKFPNDKEGLKNFLVSNFLVDEKVWVGSLLDEKHFETYSKWQKKIQSLSYIIKSDLQCILSHMDDNDLSFDKLFEVRENEHPILLQLFLQNEIEIETMIAMDRVFNFFSRWDKKVDDDILYPDVRKRIKKYQGFVSIDVRKVKSQMKEIFI